MNQYVDLGILYPEACIVKPETCTSGGTVAAWIKINDCEPGDGIFSSWQFLKTGIAVDCMTNVTTT